MSAVTAVLQAAEDVAFSGLVLFDPPTSAHARESQDIRAVAARLAERARKRQDRFEAHGELTERLHRSHAFDRLVPGTVDLIARTTLRRVVDGETGYQLCCPREYEAQIFEQLYSSAVAADIKNLSCPTKIIGADPTEPFSFLPSVDLNEIVVLDYDFVPETTHFLQLEQPQECIALMLSFLEQRKLV